MKILVIGTGAVGGYFGGRLLQAGRDVTFFVRPRRAAELAETGLNIRSPHGDVHLAAPRTVTADQLHGPAFDLALLSCKAQDLEPVMDAFAAAVRDETIVLPLLNGMRHLDALDRRFGSRHILGGVAMISAGRDPDGTIVQLTPLQQITFGARERTLLNRVQEITGVLTGAEFPVQASENILQDMWDKWVFIATLGGITCLMRASIGDIEAAGAGGVTLSLMDEAAAIARQSGFPPSPAAFQKYREMLTAPGSILRASMLRDVENGLGTEGDHILGDLLSRAKLLGIPAPTIEMAHLHMKSYESRRKRESV